jgi:dihydrofolate synthase/folylpolyglutamate synthase
VGGAGTTFLLEGFGAHGTLTTPLIGRHQAENTAFALVLLDAAGAPYTSTLDAAADALRAVRVAGRFERDGNYIFDVAHNPEGSAVLAETLCTVQPQAPVVALFSVLADKDWRAMMRNLSAQVSHFVLTIAPTAPSNRVWNLDEASRFAADGGLSAEAVPDFDSALARASALGNTTLITGSFHTVGDAMARLQASPLSR